MEEEREGRSCVENVQLDLPRKGTKRRGDTGQPCVWVEKGGASQKTASKTVHKGRLGHGRRTAVLSTRLKPLRC